MGAALDEIYQQLPDETKAYLAPLFDSQSPMSLSVLMPGNFARTLLDLVAPESDLLPLMANEEDLKKALRNNYSYQPTVNDNRIKYLFWMEYENAILDNRQMIMSNVHTLVCNEKSFKILFLKQGYRAVYLLTRPTPHQAVLRELHNHGFERLRNILELPDHDEKGRLNMKLLELKTKIITMVDMRLHGAPAQKILQHTHHTGLPGNADKEKVKQMVQKGDMNTIRKRLAEIDAESRKAEGREEAAAKAPQILEAEVVPAKPRSN